MSSLSDEDRKAIATVRQAMTDWVGPQSDPRFAEALERVLALAGEEPPEPEDQTFWYDPEEKELSIRDDSAASFGFSGDRWFTTGYSDSRSWSDLGRARWRLVQLVPKTKNLPIPAAIEKEQVPDGTE